MGRNETYRLLIGHYPELIQCDKIYHSNDNRRWCSGRNIRMTATPNGQRRNSVPTKKENGAKNTSSAITSRGALAMPNRRFRLIRLKQNSRELPRPGSQLSCLCSTFRPSRPSQV